MTAPLDENGLEAAIRAIKSPRCTCAYEDLASTAIRAYLAASPAPDGMEVVAWDRLRDLIGEYFDLGYAEGVVQRDVDTMAGDAQRTLSDIEAVISQAQSALADMREQKDEAEDAENEAKDSFWAIYPRYLELGGEPVSTEAARTDLAAQVQRLTEENEALRKALKRIADMTGTAGMEAGPLCEWTENGVTTMRPSGVGSFANAIARATLNRMENKD
jgi:hypothetical protein